MAQVDALELSLPMTGHSDSWSKSRYLRKLRSGLGPQRTDHAHQGKDLLETSVETVAALNGQGDEGGVRDFLEQLIY